MTSSPARVLALVALVAIVVVAAVTLTGKTSHTVSVTVPAAIGLVKGNRISDGGDDIGSVKDVAPADGGRKARLVLAITDNKYWPLNRATTIDVRLGGTVSFSDRYLLLHPGHGTRGTIADGGTLPSANVHIPVELDSLISQFSPTVRNNITSVIDNSSNVLNQSASSLNSALGKTAPLANNLSDVFTDLIQDKGSITTLIESTGRVVDAVDRANPNLKTLLDGAAGTFSAIASQSSNLKVALDRFPAALVQTRETLGKAETTLNKAADITDKLSPGVEQLRKTSVPLVRTLNTLDQVTPLALTALDQEHQTDVRQGGDVLTTAGDITPRLTSIVTQAASQVACIRPWTPEITLLGTNWGDWISGVDAHDHLLRATLQDYLPAQYNNVPYTPGLVSKLYSGLSYGFPRPPGALANQPWYQPQCGVTQDSTDPTKDKEGADFSANQLAQLQSANPGAKR